MLEWHVILLSLIVSISWDSSLFLGLFKSIVAETSVKSYLTADLISDFGEKNFVICAILREINKYSFPRNFSTLIFCIECVLPSQTHYVIL